MQTFTIKLSAPLQSYGDEATFSRRTSGNYPTKSAVLGMIAAALGYQRDDDRILKLNQLQFAVRIDQPGSLMTEFQTVEWKPNTRKITYRDQIQDAVFVAAIGHEDSDWIAQIVDALKHPHFQLYLGRRANVPAGVLTITEFPGKTPVEALIEIPWQAASWFKRRNQSAGYEAEVYADGALLADQPDWLVKDEVGSWDQHDRHYRFRSVARMTIPMSQTTHDAFGGV